MVRSLEFRFCRRSPLCCRHPRSLRSGPHRPNRSKAPTRISTATSSLFLPRSRLQSGIEMFQRETDTRDSLCAPLLSELDGVKVQDDSNRSLERWLLYHPSAANPKAEISSAKGKIRLPARLPYRPGRQDAKENSWGNQPSLVLK